jgi:hypothetical protein
MSEEEIPLSQHDQLAMAIAQGKSIAGWARQNGVPRRTAQRWATEPDVRRQVEDWRRRVLDGARGYFFQIAPWTTNRRARRQTTRARKTRPFRLSPTAGRIGTIGQFRSLPPVSDQGIRDADADAFFVERNWPPLCVAWCEEDE